MDGIRRCFLRCMSLIYIMAFASLYCQTPGLYGNNGILPIRLVVAREPKSLGEFLSNNPTLLSFAGRLGLTVDQAFDFLCLAGMALSILSFIMTSMCHSITYAVIWSLYFSLYQVGQTFLWFQWDILLLETGILCILLSWNWSSDRADPHQGVALFMVRWLLFRLMFMSGVVKLTSECPTWWGLTALDWHYESQCIPTSAAWYFHHLPSWFQRLSVVATFIIEIPVPFLFFSPLHSLRLFAFYMQLLLQVLIIITGNYNFFNLLTIALCLSLLEDRDLPRWIYKPSFVSCSSQSGSRMWSVLKFIISTCVLSTLFYGAVICFDLRLDTSRLEVQSRVAFSKQQFYDWLKKAVPTGIYLGIILLVWSILKALMSSVQAKGIFAKLRSLLNTVIICVLSTSIFLASLVPYTTLDEHSYRQLPGTVTRLHGRLQVFSVVHSYGLFRSMTGVGGRPEVVLEGQAHSSDHWSEYEFLYKPGNTSRRLPFVAPHQPRLDWQMWFAALGSYQHNPWFINLVYRLLNNEPDVVELLQQNPFPRHPPKFIRAVSYVYHYTKLVPGKDWWTREYSHEYLPPVSLEDSGLIDYLRNAGIIRRQAKQRSLNLLTYFLQKIRARIGQPEGFSFVSSIVASAFLIKIAGKVLGLG